MIQSEDFYNLCQELSSIPLTETWLSDQLAYLLDPQGDHGLKSQFCLAFLQSLIEIRLNSVDIKKLSTHLRRGKGGKGALLSKFSLSDTGVVREFYIIDQRYIDIVMLNLQRGDRFAVIIENKYLTQNSDQQLTTYRQRIKEMMPQNTVIEHIYLTPHGDPPHQDRDPGEEKYWISMSWLKQILPLLERFREGCERADHLYQVLNSLRALEEYQEVASNCLERSLLRYSEYLKLELNRSLKSEIPQWQISRVKRTGCDLIGPVRRIVRLAYNYGTHLKLSLSDTKRHFTKKTPTLILPLGLSDLASLSLMQVYIHQLVKLAFQSDRDLNLLRSTCSTTIEVSDFSEISTLNQHYQVYKYINYIR
jgi:hypothetical protein